MGSRRLRSAVLAVFSALALAALATGCNLLGAQKPAVCDGISSELGGCAPDRPQFEGQTCEVVAHEFGRQVDERLLAILDGPDAGGESKSVRASNYTIVAASLANLHLRRLGLVRECAAPAFVADAETQFSADFRARAGALLHDGDVPASYDEWRTWLVSLMAIIDSEEDWTPPPT